MMVPVVIVMMLMRTVEVVCFQSMARQHIKWQPLDTQSIWSASDDTKDFSFNIINIIIVIVVVLKNMLWSSMIFMMTSHLKAELTCFLCSSIDTVLQYKDCVQKIARNISTLLADTVHSFLLPMIHNFGISVTFTLDQSWALEAVNPLFVSISVMLYPFTLYTYFHLALLTINLRGCKKRTTNALLAPCWTSSGDLKSVKVKVYQRLYTTTTPTAPWSMLLVQ